MHKVSRTSESFEIERLATLFVSSLSSFMTDKTRKRIIQPQSTFALSLAQETERKTRQTASVFILIGRKIKARVSVVHCYLINMTETTSRLGVIIFPGFALLDVAGPMQFFNQLSSLRPFQLSVIAKTMDSVTTIPPKSAMPPAQYQPVGEEWLPTHTFDNAPDLDILLVPGGHGIREKTIFDDVTSFIKARYPTLKYLLSVCTGSMMVAAAGVLDGRKATSNKFSWDFATSNKSVNWIRKARWVVDGNIWSSSGVAAGMDMTYAFISEIFSLDIARRIANIMEYEPHTDPNWDPFSEIWQQPSQ